MKRIRLKRNPHCQPGIHGMFGGYGYYGASAPAQLPKMYSPGEYGKEVMDYLAVLVKPKADSVPMEIFGDLSDDQQDAWNNWRNAINAHGGKYTQDQFEVMKLIQKYALGAKGAAIDGKIGHNTWKKLGAPSTALPAKETYSSGGGGGSSSGGSSGGTNGDTKKPITDQVWFYPAVGVGSLAILIMILRAMKKNKKKKKLGTPQMRMNRY